jgi:Ser-tRNA(Ala) deacylase AlaX
VLGREQAKQELIVLFEEKTAAPEEEIKQFLKQVNTLVEEMHEVNEGVIPKEEGPADFPVRTYVIATHIIWKYTTMNCIMKP